MRRTLLVALVCAGMLILSGLALVGLRVQQVHLGYRLDGLRAERSRLDALVRQLEVEVATLRSPGRLEGRARQLGLVSPTREQVRLAREYVSAATGLAASEGGRVAVLELPPRPELRTRLPLQP